MQLLGGYTACAFWLLVGSVAVSEQARGSGAATLSLCQRMQVVFAVADISVIEWCVPSSVCSAINAALA